MAAFDNIVYSPGEPFVNVYNKINDTFTALKNGTNGQILAGNGIGSAPSFQYPLISFARVAIGDWNMDTTRSIFVGLPGFISSRANIALLFVMIRPDGDSDYSKSIPLNSVQNAAFGDFAGNNPEPQGGIDYAALDSGDTNLVLSRKQLGEFDNSTFSSTGYNRGYLTIGYIQ